MKDREFFTFFNLSESDEIKKEDQTLIKELEPGGFQDYIDIILIIDANGEIIRAKITLNRSWVGNADSLNPFAKDIVKSFIKALTPVEELAQTAALVDALFHIKGLNDKIISLNSRKRTMDEYPSEVLDFIDVYRNLLSSCKFSLQNSHFLIRNIKQEEKAYLMVQWAINSS